MNQRTRRGFLASCAGLPLAAQTPAAQLSWQPAYLFDEDDRQLALLDASFYSTRAAVAVGLLNDKGRIKPASLRTTDGGSTWSPAPLKPTPFSVQFLDEASGWMAAENGIYKSTDAGQNWKRVYKSSHVRQVRFATQERGYAAGMERTLLQTADGGRTWKPLPVAEEIKTPKEYTYLSWIELPTPTLGFVVGGYVSPRRARRDQLPAWIDPPAAERHRQPPSLTIVLQTIDGGATWKAMTSSIFGRVTRLRVNARGVGLSLVEFDDGFSFPGEVFQLDLGATKTERIFREAERAVTDVYCLDDGTFLLAAIETPGKLRTAPIPGKVHLLRGDRRGQWTEMPVDYRVTARRVSFFQAPGSWPMAVTDAGMVLRFAPEAGR